MPKLSKNKKNLLLGLAFLSPNIIGFMCFLMVPLAFSLVLAFSNWNLTLHNIFQENHIEFVGFDNFYRLLWINKTEFLKYLGNTLFFMMGIPFSIAGSLILANLLVKDLRGGNRKVFATLVCTVLLVISIIILMALNAHISAMAVLLCGVVSVILLLGVLGGSTVYRTLFYIPSFTSGVAVYILWKKLYNPELGPINTFLAGPLNSLTTVIKDNGAAPSVIMWICVLAIAFIAFYALNKFRQMWQDGELGWSAAIIPTIFVLLPAVCAYFWAPNKTAAFIIIAVALVSLLAQLGLCFRGTIFKCPSNNGLGSALMIGATMMIAQFILLGFAKVFYGLPVWAAAPQGLTPPEWLSNYHWAKPAIMIMGFWLGIGSNNMLLYIAGLSNIPQDLYEAADIDGASNFQKFWNVTWPQLAPTTFFIVVMSVIGGLQGGFEMARTMTKGGPAGATTPLSYFIYTEGFETGRMGYSSAVAWVLFILVFSVTMFNWRFGNKYVND